MQFIQARWYSPGSKSRPKQIIVLHDMETPDGPTTAASVGNYFARLPSTNKASAHIGVDDAETVRYVNDDDVAYGAPGANSTGLHIEQTGYAKFTRGEWTTKQMTDMLYRTAGVVRMWCQDYGIPMKFIDASVLAKHAPGAIRPIEDCGITTHYEVSKAWKMSSHTDPGPGYPIDWIIAAVNDTPTPTTNSTPDPNVEEDMPPYIKTQCPTGGFWLTRKSDGGVYAYNDAGTTDGPGVAPFFGSMAGHEMAAPVADFEPYIVNGVVTGYWLVGGDGGVFNFGAAPFTDSYAGHPEWHQGSRDVVGIEQHDPGYDIITVESGSNPPKIDRYDLSVPRPTA